MAKLAAGVEPVVDYPGWKSADLNRLKPREEPDNPLNPLMKMKTPDSPAPKAASPTSAKLEVVHPHAAGIDIGATEHYVCVPAQSVAKGEPHVRVRENGSQFPPTLSGKWYEMLESCGE